MDAFDEKKNKIDILQGENDEDETIKTFVFNGEDHTLGNSLRYMIMKKLFPKLVYYKTKRFICRMERYHPDVSFCGYTIPHPSEDKINVRIQTHGKPARDVLIKGLKDLTTLSEHVLRTYEKSVNDYKRRNQSSDLPTMGQSGRS